MKKLRFIMMFGLLVGTNLVTVASHSTPIDPLLPVKNLVVFTGLCTGGVQAASYLSNIPVDVRTTVEGCAFAVNALILCSLHNDQRSADWLAQERLNSQGELIYAIVESVGALSKTQSKIVDKIYRK